MISIGVGIVVSEFLLRIFLPQVSSHDKMFEYDPWLGWKFIANAKGEITYPGGVRNFVEINAMGFRDHAPSPDKEKKLMVLGDSFVSNISVKDNEVFTEIMEDELSEYDVLNFGVNGYGQVQEYLLAEQWIRNIKPEIIILMLYVQNDFTDNVGAYWSYSRPYASLESKDSVLVIHPQLKNQRSDTRDTLGIFSESHLNAKTIFIPQVLNVDLLSKTGGTYSWTPHIENKQMPVMMQAFNVLMEKAIREDGNTIVIDNIQQKYKWTPAHFADFGHFNKAGGDLFTDILKKALEELKLQHPSHSSAEK